MEVGRVERAKGRMKFDRSILGPFERSRSFRWAAGCLIAMGLLLGVGNTLLPGWAGDAFPDDHGDAAGEASLLTIPLTNGVFTAGVIERDTDVDAFRFSLLPDTVYRIEAQVGSLWDMAMEFRGPHTSRLVRATSSARSAAPAKATVIWTNAGPAGPYYVAIRGYLNFTTGTYSLVVTPVAMVFEDGGHWPILDENTNGLPDAWEWYRIGTLTNSTSDSDNDGVDNRTEFLARTLPADARSALVVRSQVAGEAGSLLQWPAQPATLYRIWGTTNWATEGWSLLDTYYHPAEGGATGQWNEVLDVLPKYYRIEIVTQP